MCSFVCDFIALEITASELVALHDDNFCKFHVSYACISDACAVEPRRRFVTERGKKTKKTRRSKIVSRATGRYPATSFDQLLVCPRFSFVGVAFFFFFFVP